MRYFPIFFDLLDRKVVVVGGGEEAVRKIRLLLKTPAQIHVIAPELHDEIKTDPRINWLATEFTPELLDGAALVYSADPELNAAVSAAAQARGIPVNAVDQASISTFIVPSIVDRDPVVVAIGTEGTAPVLGQGIRAKIDALLPAKLGELAYVASTLRARVAKNVPHGNARRSFWQNYFFGAAREALFAGNKTGFASAIKSAIKNAAMPSDGIVTLVGIGPGDAEMITIKAQRKMMQADVIIYDGDVPASIMEMARRDATRVVAPLRSHDLEKLLTSFAAGGKLVVRLISGAEQNIQAHDEYVMLRAQGVQADIVQGVVAMRFENDSPFPTRLDIQDSILRSAS
jgi:uroporphyrin-III C-methyltransferase / precorrin-2 dehydrogenase / sirohydrochlorin ferrochelatase